MAMDAPVSKSAFVAELELGTAASSSQSDSE